MKRNFNEKEETLPDEKVFPQKRRNSHRWLQINTNA